MKFSILLLFVFTSVFSGNFLGSLGEISIGGSISSAKDVFDLTKNTVTNVKVNWRSLIPSGESLVQLSKNTWIGCPVEVAIEIIDQLCSMAIASENSTQPQIQPKVEDMKYILFLENGNISFPILDSEKLWNHEKFDKNKKTVVLVTGWKTNTKFENSAAQTIWKGYQSRGDSNFVLVDTAEYVDTLYSWSAFNTIKLGQELGKGLALLSNHVPLDSIHLIGHSLGAQISGSAGKTFQQVTNNVLPRITGLDPAKPCFKEGESLQGIGRGDAEFVDIIHSDSGGLGKKEAIGDADFFPNGIVLLMPGCMDISCSHGKAWEYYAESVYKSNVNNFMAKKCGSLRSYEINACIGQEIPMGFACPLKAKGNFFLKTHSKSPYGRRKKN